MNAYELISDLQKALCDSLTSETYIQVTDQFGNIQIYDITKVWIDSDGDICIGEEDSK